MKKTILSLMAASAAGLLVSASAQPAPGDESSNPPPAAQPTPPPEGGNGPEGAGAPPPPPPDFGNAAPAEGQTNQTREPAIILPSQAKSMQPEEYQSRFVPPSTVGTNGNDLNLNFNRAPLDEVLNYMSDAAGFIIVQDTRVSGLVTVKGKHLTKDEAVDLLNAVLNKNGYAALRDGRTLTIVDKNDAKTREIPVKTGNNPANIPKNAEIVTQIIPIRFVEARQLVQDLSSFVSPQATVVANEAGNSIVITDTQANIRHIAEIIRAVDDGAEAETEIQVFPLKYANPTDVATELTSVFPSGNSTGGASQAPTRFAGGPGGFFRQMMANAASGGGNSSSDRIKKATAVTAVADARIQAVIVTAPKDLIQEISGVIKNLDVPSERDQNVYVFKMKNGDPQQALQVLQGMFSNGNTSRNGNSSSQNSVLMQRAVNGTTTMGNTTTTSGIGGSTGGIGGGRGGGGGQY